MGRRGSQRRWPVAACVWALGTTPSFADDAVCNEVLVGQVFDAFSDEPIPQAAVIVQAVDGHTHRSVLTDTHGDFKVDGLCAGAVDVLVVRDGYAHKHIDLSLPAAAIHVHIDQDVEEVMVQTARLGTEAFHASTTIQGEALERTRGQGLAEAVAQVPGVAVLRGTSNNAKPIIRGQYGRRLLTLFDGVRHASQSWGLDHAPEIDPFTADRITVVKGAAGVRYGSDAIGGVVLVSPRPLRDTPGIDGAAHFVEMWNGLRTTGALRLDGASAKAPGFAWRVEGSLAKGTALQTPTYTLGNTASEQWNAGATLGYRHRSWQFTVSYRHHATRAGVCNCIASSTAEEFFAQLARDRPLSADTARVSFDIARPYQAVTHDTVLARATGKLAELGTLQASYSLQINHRQEYETARSSITGPQFDFTLRTHALELSFAHTPRPVGPSAKIEGTVGASGSFQDNVFSGLPLIPNYRSSDVGVFAVERLWSRRWELEVGGRYDTRSQSTYLTNSAFNRHVARDRLSEDDCEVGDDAARCDLAWHAGSVTVGGLWRAVEQTLAFKIDLSSASRFPDADELYMNGTSPTFPVYGLGDPALGVETTWGGSLTALVDTRWLVGEVSGYANYIHNYLYFAPELGPDGSPAFDVVSRGTFPRFSYRSIDAAFYGMDGGVRIAPDEPLDLAVSTSIVRARDLTNDGYLVYVPPDRVSATLTYKAPPLGRLHDTSLSIRGDYVAEQTRVDPAADLAPAPDGFFLLGFGVSTQLHVANQVVRLGVEARNLLNTRYRDYTSLLRYYADEPGRDVVLRASVQFAL